MTQGSVIYSAENQLVPLPIRNVLINGNFDVWQRGTSFVSLPNDTFTADRWQVGYGTSSVEDITRDTSVPTVAESGVKSTYSLKFAVTTADASIAAGEVNYIRNKIEGFDFVRIAHRPLTLSFWVRSNVTGVNCVTLINGDFDRSFVSEYTINVADTWEKKVIPILASPTSGIWNYTTGIGLGIYFVQAAGTTFQTTPGAWQTGFYLGTSSLVNRLATVGNNLYISQVQLEASTEANRFEVLPFTKTLEQCRRYYLKSYAIDNAPASITAGGVYSRRAPGVEVVIPCTFPVVMRATPTIVFYSTNTGATGKCRNVTTGTDANASVSNTGMGNVNANCGTTIADTDHINVQFTAEAEI